MRVVAAPHGTCSAHTTTFSSGSVRSGSPVTPAGLSIGTTMVMVFVANTVGDAVRPSAVAIAMVGSSAVASTSPGAPCCNWATRSDDPAKLNRTVVPGLSR